MSKILGPDGRPARRSVSATSWWQVYDAAKRLDFRGYFYIPSLSPGAAQDSLTRRAIAERVDWLTKNVGAVGAAIDGLALDEVGTGIWPKWTTSSTELNSALTDAFHYTNHDPRVFSADSHNDCYSVQYNIRRMIRRYGDGFGQFLRPSPGSVNPSMHLVPGYLVDNIGSEKDGRSDGVLTNGLNRPINYRVLQEEHGDGFTDVPADDILHFHDPFLPGQRRGVPDLAAVCKKLFSREDIFRALTNGTLQRELMGFAIQTKGDGEAGPLLPASGEVEEVTNPDGSKYTLQKIFGQSAGDEVQIPQLEPGEEIKLLESSRPGTAVVEFLDNILREVAYASGYPPEYVFFHSKVGQGTVARLVLQRSQAVITSKREFQLKPQFCNRWNVFWAWQRISSGSFGNIAVPKDWWKHKLISPALMSMDVGREGKLYDDRVATGKMSPALYHGMQGEDDSDVEDEVLEAFARRLEKLKALNKRNGTSFTYFDLWPRTSSAQAPLAEITPE